MLGFGWDTGALSGKRRGPSGPPATVLDFTAGVLPAGVSVTRSSPATVVNPAGVRVTVPANSPRFDHDPETGAPLGLLLEGGTTNFAPDADFTTYQSGNNTIVQAMPAVTGPDGQTGSVYRLQHGAQSSTYLKLRQFTGTDAKVISLWVKAMGANTAFQLYADGSAGISPVLTATGEWTRVHHSAARAGQWGINNGGDTYGTDILVALPQIEFGLSPSSYVPPSGGNAPRSADIARLDGINGIFDVTLRYGSGVEEPWSAQSIENGWWPPLSGPHLMRITLRPTA